MKRFVLISSVAGFESCTNRGAVLTVLMPESHAS